MTTLLQTSGNVTLPRPPRPRACGPGLKASLNAYSFNRLLSRGLERHGDGMSLFDLLDYCADQGFDAVDVTGYYFPGYPDPPDPRYVNDLKRRAFLSGLDISGTGVRNDFTSPDRDRREEGIRHVRAWVEVAARLGAPVLRVFSGPEPKDRTWQETAEWAAEALRECAEHGRESGVLIGVQNHWDFLKTSRQIIDLVRMVGSEWLGVVVDTGSLLAGDPYGEMAAVAPYAVNWQVKEYADGRAFQRRLDLGKVVQIALDAGYRGCLPIETLSRGASDDDPRVRAAELLKELRSAIHRTARPSRTD